MQRRHFLRAVNHSAAWLAWHSLFATPSVAQTALRAWTHPADVFTLGVASGEPRPDSVVLWTRLAPQPLAADGGMPAQPVVVRWELALDDRFAQVVQQGEAVAQPAHAHSVHVEVRGLPSDRRFFYRFMAAGQSSVVGRTRTAPEPGARTQALRFALASCQHYELGYFTVHREIAASDIDFVLFVGDYLYQTEVLPHWRVRQHKPEFGDDASLAHYRIHYGMYKSDPDLRACHAAHPWLLTWDDHEVRNDYDGVNDPDGELTVAQFKALRARAYKAYFEHMPISPLRAPVGPDAAFHTRYTWGQLADIWLLDTRQLRDGPVCMGPLSSLLWQCEAASAPARTVLGAAQEHWLADGLARSQSQWRLIAQTTQMSPGVFKTPAGPLQYADGWDAFAQARERLMAAIAQPRVPDVVCLGGDVHRHVAAYLRSRPTDPASPVVASEFVTSSITSRGLSELLTGWLKSGNPDMLHCRSDQRGYSLFTVNPQQMMCDFRATAHPVMPDSRLHTQARFVVQRGVPGPQKA